MRSKIINFFIFSTFLILCSACFSACNKPKEFTFNFYLNNELYKTEILNEEQLHNYVLSNPQSMDGYIFLGWNGSSINPDGTINVEKVLKQDTYHQHNIYGTYESIILITEQGEAYLNPKAKHLTEINVPSTINNITVTKIKDYGFSENINIKSITLPNTLMEIGQQAFANCHNLFSITIPENVSLIDEFAFYNCFGLTEVYNLSELNIQSSSEDNGYIGKYPYYIFNNTNELVEYTTIDGTKYAIEEQNKLIAVGIEDKNTTKIDIDYNTIDIRNYAFTNCPNVTDIYYKAEIAYNAPEDNYIFFKTGTKNDVTIHIDSQVKRIPPYMFNCTWPIENEEDIVYPKLTQVIFNEDSQCEVINGYAFANNFFLKEITIPKYITAIYANAFYNCTAVEVINFNAINCQNVGSNAFYSNNTNSKLCTLNIGNQVKVIPAISNPSYKEIKFSPSSQCEAILDRAFIGSKNLNKVTLPESIISIGEQAFESCTNLKTIIIPKNVQEIKYQAFYNCINLIEVYNYSHLQLISGNKEYGYISYYAPAVLTSESDINNFIETDGVIYYLLDTNKYVAVGLKDKTITNLVLDEKTTHIRNYAFYNCNNLISATIPENLTSIGISCFNECANLEYVYYNAINCATETDYRTSAGYGLDKTINIFMGDKVGSIPNYFATHLFGYMASQREMIVEFSNNSECTNIGTYAFYHCKLKIILPKSLETITENAFIQGTTAMEIYYLGSQSEWNNINKTANDFSSINVYYYIENQSDMPQDNNKYWHYVDDIPTLWE